MVPSAIGGVAGGGVAAAVGPLGVAADITGIDFKFVACWQSRHFSYRCCSLRIGQASAFVPFFKSSVVFRLFIILCLPNVLQVLNRDAKLSSIT